MLHQRQTSAKMSDTGPLTIILVILVTVCQSVPNPGDPRACLKEYNSLKRFEAIPGSGWDNLRNMETLNLVVQNYSQCQTTLDGRFLIPDGVETIPRKSSKLDTFAEVFFHYTDYPSATARSINVNAGLAYDGYEVSGSFADRYLDVRRSQIQTWSLTTRVGVQYHLYTSTLKPNFQLAPDFKSQLADIAESLLNNKTAEAKYKTQLLIRNYGTHLLTSLDVGALLSQEDQISKDFLSTGKSVLTDLKVSAGANFLNIFNFGASYGTLSSKTDIEKYRKSRLSSSILTIGGPQFMTHNFTINEWAKQVEDNMVAIDRRGDPLHLLITEKYLPDFPAIQIYSLKSLVEEAIDIYYRTNTYIGCTNRDSPNFKASANADDGSCEPPINATRFGGTFQNCTLDWGSNDGDVCGEKDMNRKNPLTGDYSCPEGYETVKIHSAVVSTDKPYSNCMVCGFQWCCPNSPYGKYKLSQGHYSIYWCGAVGDVSPNSGYLFGGVYTKENDNPLTGDKTCPISFFPENLGTGLQVCVSGDYDTGHKYAQMFGGFFSCDSGNPLAMNSKASSSLLQTLKSSPGDWPQQCPGGYSQRQAYEDQGCQISYCFQSDGTYELPKIKLPPFPDIPDVNYKSVSDRPLTDPMG